MLFGTNSAGKTSIPQLLMLLKQTAESSDRQRVLHFGDRRTALELGGFTDIVHNHQIDQSIQFSVRWTMPSNLTVRDPLSRHTVSSDRLRFQATIAADGLRNPYVRSMEYSLGDSDTGLRVGMDRKATGTKYDLSTEGYREVRQQGRKWPLPAPVQFHGFPDEAVACYQNTGFVSDLNLEVTRLLQRIHYVGPLREYPKRLYQWSGEIPVHVGDRGDRALEAILASRGRMFNFGKKQRLRSLEEVVAERLKKMGLAQGFELRVLAEHRKEYEVLVRTGKKRPKVLLTDVGIGVSQVLPVIVECFYVPAHSIVIFEQPEIHLHPRAQAELADLFVDAIHARENASDRNVQFIIESHSEHFLRRLQRRIAEGTLKAEEAALYFAHNDASAARLEELEALMGPSRVGTGPMEGVYLRQDRGPWLGARAKLVRAEFVQAIGTHWSRRPLQRNGLVGQEWSWLAAAPRRQRPPPARAPSVPATRASPARSQPGPHRCVMAALLLRSDAPTVIAPSPPSYTPPVSIRLLLAILLIPSLAAAEPLSLEAAVDEALRGNLGLLIARYEALLADDAAALAIAGYEPRASASVSRSTDFVQNTGDLVDVGVPFASTIGSLGVTQAIPGGGTASLSYSQVVFDDKSDANPYEDTASLIIDVRQPLLNGAILGQRERSIADANFGVGDAAIVLHTAIADLVLEIEEAYWALVQTDQAVTAATLSLESADHQEAWVKERIDLGFDSPSEQLATQERVASAQASKAGATAARANAEARLLYLLGRELRGERATLEPSTLPSAFVVLPEEAAQASAAENNLEVRLVRRQLSSARRDLRFTVLEQLPALDASFSVRPDLASDVAPWSFGLSVSTPLPGRGRVHGILAARARVRQAEIRLRNAEQRLRLQVEVALRSVDTARAQVALSEVGLDVAQRKFDAEGERLSRGRSTNKTVLDYLEDRDQAVRNRDDTLVALARAAAQVRRLTGTNLEFWGVVPSDLLERRKELR